MGLPSWLGSRLPLAASASSYAFVSSNGLGGKFCWQHIRLLFRVSRTDQVCALPLAPKLYCVRIRALVWMPRYPIYSTPFCNSFWWFWDPLFARILLSWSWASGGQFDVHIRPTDIRYHQDRANFSKFPFVNRCVFLQLPKNWSSSRMPTLNAVELPLLLQVLSLHLMLAVAPLIRLSLIFELVLNPFLLLLPLLLLLLLQLQLPIPLLLLLPLLSLALGLMLLLHLSCWP